MKSILFACFRLILCLNVLTLPALSAEVSDCHQHQEIFKFQVDTYAMQHQGGAILNIKLAYRLTPEAISLNTYPDFVPIRKDIESFLTNYPNKTDFWEIVNKKLVKFLLNKYPQIASLGLEIGIMPTPNESHNRTSIVYSTRPHNCPMTGQQF